MEAEDDEFGELYCDVLKPFTLLSSTNIKNPTDEKPEACSTNSADIRCSLNDGAWLQQNADKGEEVLGTVKLEIYLGLRRVFKNKFVFPVGGIGIDQADNDSGFNQSGNLLTDDGGKEMTSVQGNVNHSQSEKIVACEAAGDLNSNPDHINDSPQCNRSERGRSRTVDVGDSNSDPECKINQKEKDSRVGVIVISSIEPCKPEPSEEGQLSEYAELESDRATVIRNATLNSVEEVRIGLNKNERLVAATPICQMTTSRPYRHQAKTRFPDMSASLFDLDLNGLEPKPWRRPSENISDYFNFGLDEASWKSYCEDIKATRRYTGKPIHAEHGVRDHRLPSWKAIQWDSTFTIQDKPPAFRQREHNKSYHRPAFELSGSKVGRQNSHEVIFAGMKREEANGSECNNHEMGSKRAKVVEEASRESSSNMSDNEWMCRHVGMDSWFHPSSLPEQQRNRHQETKVKGSKRGRSKLERWTRHDQDDDDDDDDENTSTSSLASPFGVAVELEE